MITINHKKYTFFFVFFILLYSLTYYNFVFAYSDIDLTAYSSTLFDQTSGRLIFEKNAYEKIFPASTTKILTTLVALEYIDLDKLYTIGNEINDVPLNSSKAGHKINEKILGQNLIRGLIIPSGNDTARVVAKIVAQLATKKNNLSYKDAEKEFSNLMNKKAQEIGALNSNFVNPHGYHDDNHYTTAYDMGLISIEAMKNDFIKEVASSKNFIGNGAGDESSEFGQNYKWSSHNLLINSKNYIYPYANGLKTGFTNQSGYSVVATAEKNDEHLLAVIFKSNEPQRWIDAKALFDYTFDNYDNIQFLNTDTPVSSMPLFNQNVGEPSSINLYPENNFEGYYSKDEFKKIDFYIEYDDNKIFVDDQNQIFLKAPIAKQQSLGTVFYKLDDTIIFQSTLLSSDDIKDNSFLNYISYYINFIKNNLFTLSAIPIWLILLAVLVIFYKIFVLLKNRIRKNGLRFK